MPENYQQLEDSSTLSKALQHFLPIKDEEIPDTENNESGGFKNAPIIIGAGCEIGKSSIALSMAMASLYDLHKEHRSAVIIQQEEEIESITNKLEKFHLEKQKYLLTKPYDEEEVYFPTQNEIQNKKIKCRMKDSTKSLAKRRAKNKIAKKSKQKNRK